MRPVPPDRLEAQGTPVASGRLARYRSPLGRLARLLGVGHRKSSSQRTLRLALECRACRGTYRYEVERVYLDPEQAGAEAFIQDRIQCQGCGRWDQYSLTPDAHADILTESLRLLSHCLSGDKAPRSPVTLVSSGLQDGRRMHPEEGLRDYERCLGEHPDDPGLHLGRANILRFLKRFEAAAAGYRRAIELDPHAVEAHSSLAQLAAERGDVAEAARGFERCVRALPHGHFYRLPEGTREDFSAAVKENAERFCQLARHAGDRAGDGLPSPERGLEHRSEGSERVLSGEPATRQAIDAAQESPHQQVALPIVGRNAPCPCGSGKKYKMCCLPVRDTEPPAPTPLGAGVEAAADEELGRYLAEFAARVPRRERDRAMTLFAEARSSSAGRAEDAHADAVGFMDWFINDYRLRTSGRTIVEEILVTRPRSLTRGARTLLASWRDRPVTLYEVVAVEPGAGITLRDLFGSGLHEVRDVRGSRALARWDVVATRLIPIGGAMRVAATVLVFLPEEKEWLLEEVERRLGAWRQAHPSAGVEQSLKADGLLFHRLACELAERRRETAKSLKAVTAEGHPVVFAKARYRMTDAARVLAALRSAEDFAQSEPGPGELIAFVWLKLGGSARLAVASSEVPEGAVQFTRSFLATPDAEPIPTLGDVRIRGRRLFLESLSRERLGWGKARLADLLGDAARFEAERFESMDTKCAAADGRSGASGGKASRDARGVDSDTDDETYRAISSRHLRDHYRRWIDEPLPALGGLSPRDAVHAPEQRAALEGLLRRMENLEDRRRMTGAASCDVSWIRRALGM